MKLIDLSGVREACIDSRVIDIQPTTVLIISDGLVAIIAPLSPNASLILLFFPQDSFPMARARTTEVEPAYHAAVWFLRIA